MTAALASRASGARRTRIEGIDLLRGAAVALVMLRHALPDQFAGAGVVGVVMFFALSGHLITGVLLDELRGTGRIALRRFTLNRAVRLGPALVVMIVVFVAVTLTVDPLDDRHQLVRTVLVALTYTGDLPFDHGSDATFHLWTLAMEEQFYLVWPAVLLLAWRRRRVQLALVVAALAAVAASVVTLVWLHPYPDLAYQLPTSWAVCFVIGAATRVHADRIRHRPGAPRRLPTWLAVVVPLAALAALSVVPLRGHAWTYLVAAPLVALLAAVLLLRWRQWEVVRPALLRPVVALGTISYGAYLWNYPLILWLEPSLGWAAALVGSVLTVVAAWLSWRLVERPLQQRVRRSRVSSKAHLAPRGLARSAQ